jgi:hypothetical protein
MFAAKALRFAAKALRQLNTHEDAPTLPYGYRT